MKIVAISAGQYIHKKDFHPIKNKIRYINYGLLGLSTILHDQLNIDVIVAQGDNLLPNEFVSKLEQDLPTHLRDCSHFLLSIPSYYSISWCQELCKLLKERYNKKIIVGGRWVVDNNVDWIKEKLLFADEVIEGFGEKKLAKLFCPEKENSVEDGKKQCFEHLNYKLLLDYKQYQPSIEVSRGCGMGCAFCADRANKRLPNKSVEQIVSELNYLDTIYTNYNAYLEAPHFHFDKNWCQQLVEAVKLRNKVTPWRCTTRVESVKIELIKDLAEAGLKIIDIGLESASPTQLVRMGKTQNPDKYLSKAENILRECQKHNVWVKFNILLFAGETQKTIDETIAWLQKHKHLIKGVSVSSLAYYKGAGKLQDLLTLGAVLPEKQDPEETGFVHLHPSTEISLSDADKIALQISRIIMNQKDYYDLKSVSYFESGYTYQDFIKDLTMCDTSKLPFETEQN